MKKALLVFAVLLLLAPAAARAGGVNFNWGSMCYTVNPVSARTFACNSNTSPAAWRMTVSFMIDTPMADFVGLEITIMGWSPDQTLPDWWKMGASPDCRSGVASFSSDMRAVADETCLEWTAGQAYDLFGIVPLVDPGRIQINAGEAIDASTPYALQADVEYYGGTVTILNGKTVGDGACGGCAAPMSWGLYSVVVCGLDGRRDGLWDAVAGGNQCLDWNGPYPNLCVHGAAENTTWGAVKSLYR